MSLFDSPMLAALSKDLDGLWTRYRVIEENLANYETPNYKAKRVSFENQLKVAMENVKTKSQAIQQIQEVAPQITEYPQETLRLDGNNVDIEKENLEMARTQFNYQYSLRMLTDEYARLRSAINEGRK